MIFHTRWRPGRRFEEMWLRKEGINFMPNILTGARGRIPCFALVAIIATATTTEIRVPFGTWERASDAPIISPQGEGFESAGTFNPTVVKNDGKFVMLYRAQDHQGKSSLDYATSEDGIHFVTRPE